jgi:hypothetical protein
VRSPFRLHHLTEIILTADRTGANGSVGGAVSLQLLKAGYHLRAVVRNEEKGGYLREGLKALGYGEESVQVVLVPDMAAPGSLDEALKGKLELLLCHNAHLIELTTPSRLHRHCTRCKRCVVWTQPERGHYANTGFTAICA